MSVTIPLNPQAESRLRERAGAAGEDLAGFVSKLVEHFGSLPTPLQTLSGPVAECFRESGDSEQQLIDEIERAKADMRADRRRQGSSQ